MKKNMNKSSDYVIEMLSGIEKSNKDVSLDKEKLFIYKTKHEKNKVAIISGGGAGHEPAHAGYVGNGMLAAAVSGHVFSSPTPDQVLAAIKKVDADETLLVIKNYTGDVMNFKIAADLASVEGKKVDYVVVDDDVAVENSTWTEGKRGVAGTIFVHKIAGAAANLGKPLSEVKEIAEKVIKNVKTIGVAFDACSSPETLKKSFDLGDDEIEFGVGIHGEPGISKQKHKSSKELVSQMTKKVLESFDGSPKEVAIIVNGMGGTPLSELYIAANDLFDELKAKKIKVTNSLIGDYMTSLDMSGFSISILKLDDEMKELLDSEAIIKF